MDVTIYTTEDCFSTYILTVEKDNTENAMESRILTK